MEGVVRAGRLVLSGRENGAGLVFYAESALLRLGDWSVFNW